jgi:hypothetical protein
MLIQLEAHLALYGDQEGVSISRELKFKSQPPLLFVCLFLQPRPISDGSAGEHYGFALSCPRGHALALNFRTRETCLLTGRFIL